MDSEEIIRFFVKFCEVQRLDLTPERLTKAIALVNDDPEYWQSASMWDLWDCVLEEEHAAR